MMQKKSKLSTIGTRNLVKLFGHKRKDRKEKEKKEKKNIYLFNSGTKFLI